MKFPASNSTGGAFESSETPIGSRPAATAPQFRERWRMGIEARALVSNRMKPLKIDGRTVHQVALPWHWGTTGPGSHGDAANDLLSLSGDPNTTMHESKAFVCDVRAGRVGTGTQKLAGIGPLRDVAANEDDPIVEEHPEQ